jgi:NitT/TauT family transport system ATP-binding protein
VNVLQRSGQEASSKSLRNGSRRDAAQWGGTAIQLSEISKVYGRGPTAVHAVDRLSLTVGTGEFVCLVGASGCGKSTLLSIVAGLDAPTGGQVDLGGRRVAMMFQEPALFPWLTARRNVELAMRARKVPKDERQRRAAELLDTVHLGDFADKRPHELSGGMRQRVALARSLAQDVDILLMDEPFGALDAITREEMSECLLDIWERTGKTVVLVTHSIDEAVFLSREVHVMGTGPARIIETLPISLPHPRTEDSYADPAFAAAENRLRGLLIESHRRRRP